MSIAHPATTRHLAIVLGMLAGLTTHVTAANAQNLHAAWTFSTGVLRGHEGQPLVIGNTMYVVTPYPNVSYALDLATDDLDAAREGLLRLEHPEAPGALSVRARAAIMAGDMKEAKRLAKLFGTSEPVGGALLDGEAELVAGKTSRAVERFGSAIS